MTDRLGRVREFGYFNNNLLQTETWKNSAGGSAVNTRSFTYNENGQPLTAADNNGTYAWTYDELGRVETQEDPFDLTLTWAYDAADRLDTASDSLGGEREYTWDDADRVTAVSFTDSPSELRVEYAYNNRDEVTEMRRYSDAAGTTLTSKSLYGYDDAGKVTSITHKDHSNATIDAFNYQYDDAGRVTQETSTLGPTRDYEYDKTDQLIDDGDDTYAWDLGGNPAESGWEVGDANRLLSDGTWDYQYDESGNVTAKENISTGQLWNYFYNHQNALVKAERKPIVGQRGLVPHGPPRLGARHPGVRRRPHQPPRLRELRQSRVRIAILQRRPLCMDQPRARR
jgi:YD repeat-containing protein